MPRSSLPKPAPSTPTAPPAWFRLKRMFGLAPDAIEARSTAWPAVAGKNGAPAHMPRVSDYTLEHVIARNDRATIYQATERSTGRLIALKTVRIGSTSGTDRGLWRERFLREAAAAARLKHDYIVAVHAGGVQGEGDATTGWLAMEWVHGTDMSRYACTSRLLPEGVVVGICLRVAAVSATRAEPKSVTLTVPVVGSNRMLEGLMSRWTMPERCARSNASATRWQMPTTTPSGSMRLAQA